MKSSLTNCSSLIQFSGIQLSGVLVCVALGAGCQKTEKAHESSKAETPAPSRQVADKQIEKSLAEASKKGAEQDVGMPPRDGILPLNRADLEAPVNGVPKLVVGSTGSEPRVKLAAPEISESRRGEVEVAVRTGPTSALPTVVLSVKADALKAEPGGSGSRVHFDLVQAALGKDQPGAIPEEFKRQVQLLKGSTFNYALQDGKKNGSVSYERSKSTPEDGELWLGAAASILDAVLVALPEDPVGKGAFWVTTKRERFLGADVVTYQMLKVLDSAPESVKLELNTHRYAVGNRLAIPGLEGGELVQFESADKGQLVIVPGERCPVDSVVQQSLVAVIATEQGKGPFQLDSQGHVSFAPAPQSKKASK
jgi:hypothetical protein